MKIALGTASALKIRAVDQALANLGIHEVKKLGDLDLFPYTLVASEIESIVAAQPFGIETIFRGAEHRARTAREINDADIGIGIENGLAKLDERWFDLPAVVISYPRYQVLGRALGASLPIPFAMVDESVEKHLELGIIVQKRIRGGEKDPHRFLSKGVLDRSAIITQAVLAAFVPVISADEYRIFNPNE